MSWLLLEENGTPLPTANEDWLYGATVPDGWSFARSDSAMGRSPTGRWVTYAANVPRPNYDPITLEDQGLLIEPSRTQLIFKSRPAQYTAPQEITQTTAADIQTPFGLGCTRLTPTTTLGVHTVNLYFGGTTAALMADNSTVSIRLVIKPDGAYSHAWFFLQGKDAAYRSVHFSMEGSGSIVSTTNCSAKIKPDTDGFFDVQMTVSYGIGTTTASANMSFALDDGTRNFAADGTSSFLVAYFGAEVGAEATSPIISTSQSVVRQQDVLTSNAEWWANAGSSFAIDFTPLAAADQVVLHAVGTESNSLYLANSQSLIQYSVIGGGSVSANLSGVAHPTGLRRTLVITAAGDEFRLAQNGTQLATDISGSAPINITSVRVGALNSGSFAGPMLLHRIKYWKEALPKDAAVSYSADISLEGQLEVLPVLDIQEARFVSPSENLIELTVTMSGGTTGATVLYRTVDGTAISGVDYIGISGSLLIPAGENSASFQVGLPSRVAEIDKTFRIELYGADDAKIGTGVCSITLQKVIPQGPPATTQANFGTTLPAGFTLTRASPAMRRNTEGLWTQVAADSYRHHSSAPGISGLLIETQASDQCLFDSVNPGFAAVASTLTLNTTTQVSTGTRSIIWREAETTELHKLSLSMSAANSQMPTGEFTIWVMIRPTGRFRYKMRVKGIDNIWDEAGVNLVGAGFVVYQDVGVNVYIETDPFFPGWFAVGIHNAQSASAGVPAEFEITSEDEGASVIVAGNTANGFDLAHIQVETGQGMSSPIVVNGASAKTARAADILRADAAATFYKVASYALGIRFVRLRRVPIAQRLVMLKDVPNNLHVDDIGIEIINDAVRANLRAGSVTLPAINALAPNVPGIVSTALLSVNAASSIGLFLDGVKVGSTPVGPNGPATPIAAGAIRLGATEPSGLNPGNFLIQAVYHWNTALGDGDATMFSGNLNYSPPPSNSVVSVPARLTVAEGKTLSIPITRTGAGNCSVSVRSRGVSATTPADYSPIDPTVISFTGNETTKTITLTTIADADPEGNQTLEIILSAPVNCGLGQATCIVTIQDPPVVAVPVALNVNEGSAVTVTLTKTGIGACTVSYKTEADTAAWGTDYIGIDLTTVTFGENETTKTVQVQTVAGGAPEVVNETFRFVLSAPVGCTLGNPSCLCTIVSAGVAAPDEQTGIYDSPAGFATYSSTVSGGVGYAPYYVTDLGDTNTQGTLRHALSSGNKVIVFEVGGVIKITNYSLRTSASNVTIAGETAPSPGIIIQNGEFMPTNLSNMHISHITFERGYDMRQENFTPGNGNSNGDAIVMASGTGQTLRNVWYDHCATFWSNDEAVQMWTGTPGKSADGTWPPVGTMTNISFTNCLFAEPLYMPETLINPATKTNYKGHWEGGEPERLHNYGLIIGYHIFNVDIQNSAWVDCYWRCPMIDGDTSTVLANNLSVNCRVNAHVSCNQPGTEASAAGRKAGMGGPVLNTTVGYLAISGPDTRAGVTGFRMHSGTSGYPANSKIWVDGLYSMQGKDTTVVPLTTITYQVDPPSTFVKSLIVDKTAVGAKRPIDIPGSPVKLMTANEIYDRAKKNIGPRPKERAQPHIKRVMTKIEGKTGKWVNHQSDVGGFSGSSTTPLANTTRSLRSQNAANPPKFKDGTTVIPAFPSNAADKAAVRAWLKRFKDELQYD